MKHYAYQSPFRMVDEEGNNYKLIIEQDDISENPREWSNLATMICFYKRYDLGDKHNYDGVHEMLEDLAEEIGLEYEGKNTPDLMTELSPYYCIKPLYLYDHSGITISTSDGHPYNDRWDAGCIGFAYISKEKAIANSVDVKENWQKYASKCIDSEVQTYDQYLTGEVYGYKLEKEVTIEEKCPHWR